MQCERPIPREETYECSRVGPVSGDVSLDGEGQGQERRVSIQTEKAWTVPEIRYSGSQSIHQQSACGMSAVVDGELVPLCCVHHLLTVWPGDFDQ